MGFVKGKIWGPFQQVDTTTLLVFLLVLTSIVRGNGTGRASAIRSNTASASGL